MKFDTVLCVGTQHKEIALKTLRSLFLFTSTKRIFVITASNNIQFFKKHVPAGLPVSVLNQDEVIACVNLDVIQDELIERTGASDRSGWYFQQFLKMGVSLLDDLSDYYLVWDADTVLLRRLDFFDDKKRVMISKKSEHHAPYFETLDKLLGIKKQVDFSFISEHLMIKKEYMQSLLNRIGKDILDQGEWVLQILSAIPTEHLPRSGFSEYETYGNFIAAYCPESFEGRTIKTLRSGTKIYGRNPDKYAFFDLIQSGYCATSFESWQPSPALILKVSKSFLLRFYWFKSLLKQASLQDRYSAIQISSDIDLH